ncbi:MAG: hypothetical protein ABI175_14890 [Polyangiales bacterium]
MCRAVLLLCLASCGRLGFEPLLADGAPDVSSARCDLSTPFGAPVPVAGVSTPGLVEATSRLTDDELTMYLWTSRGSSPDLERATRATEAEPFAGVALSELNSPGLDFEPTITPDELVVIFHSDRGGTGAGDLFVAQRGSVSEPFAMLGELANLDTTGEERQPYLGSTELYFASDRGGTFDIYRAARLGPTSFGAPSRVDVPGLTVTDDADPVISRDGLTLFFASDAPGGLGGGDIYVTTRASLTSAFGPPVAVSQLSSAAAEGPSWISPDGCRLYLSSARAGSPDIYVASRGM